ncbi:MAG: NAD-dependent deacylase [Anaerolineales bacterium]
MKFPAELLHYLRAASRVAVLTGAGASQESGLRTFRDAQDGLWAQYRPEDLATPQAFAENPRLVWDFYAMRRLKAGEVQPNPGHYALAALEKRFADFTLITQNVDGLHQRAGSQKVIELHGSITRARCSACGFFPENWADSAGDEVPPCPRCGALLRPDVVWFGETLPPEALSAAVAAVSRCQAFFSIGTSGLVQPAASLAFAAKQRGAVVVEINAEATPLTPSADFFFAGRSGEILPTLLDALNE